MALTLDVPYSLILAATPWTTHSYTPLSSSSQRGYDGE